MNKKTVSTKPAHVSGEQYGANPHLYRYDNLEFGKDTIVDGTKIRFKGRRGVFTFRHLYHNSDLDVTWINCLENKTGRMRSFYVDELKMIVKPKKSRAKKSG